MKDNHELAMERFAAQQTWMEKTGGFARDMTLRDHFAGLATQGLLTAELVGEYSNEHVAEIAYVIADAMLKDRAK
jgi:hypothetical protein